MWVLNHFYLFGDSIFTARNYSGTIRRIATEERNTKKTNRLYNDTFYYTLSRSYTDNARLLSRDLSQRHSSIRHTHTLRPHGPRFLSRFHTIYAERSNLRTRSSTAYGRTTRATNLSHTHTQRPRTFGVAYNFGTPGHDLHVSRLWLSHTQITLSAHTRHTAHSTRDSKN